MLLISLDHMPDIVIPKHEVQFFNNNEYQNTTKEYEKVYFKADAPNKCRVVGN